MGEAGVKTRMCPCCKASPNATARTSPSPSSVCAGGRPDPRPGSGPDHDLDTCSWSRDRRGSEIAEATATDRKAPAVDRAPPTPRGWGAVRDLIRRAFSGHDAACPVVRGTRCVATTGQDRHPRRVAAGIPASRCTLDAKPNPYLTVPCPIIRHEDVGFFAQTGTACWFAWRRRHLGTIRASRSRS